jgi:heme exporter protein D
MSDQIAVCRRAVAAPRAKRGILPEIRSTRTREARAKRAQPGRLTLFAKWERREYYEVLK